MTDREYTTLYEKYLKGECSVEEEAVLFSYQDQFKFFVDDHTALDESEKQSYDLVRKNLMDHIGRHQVRPIRRRYWQWAAAAVLVLGVGATLVLHRAVQQRADHRQPVLSSAVPVKALVHSPRLILANGTVIRLDQAGRGRLASDRQAAVDKPAEGKLVYQSSQGANTGATEYNTLDIPRGSQYQLTLPDGSKVWLNAESTLTYPIAFKGKERRVVLKGEAYFEVSKNKDMPFIVQTGLSETRVLGTHFNVSAYAGDAAVSTTLLEGSVSFSGKGAADVLLKPGEQGSYRQTGQQIAVKAVKTSEAVAWIKGYFIFNGTPVSTIMKQISRWYDVETVIGNESKDIKFSGVYARSTDLNELLEGLKSTGLVHFKVEGRRITVMP